MMLEVSIQTDYTELPKEINIPEKFMDISKKLQNSSASPNFKSIDNIVNYFNNWKYPERALMGGAPDKYYNIVEVDKIFEV